MTPSLSESAPPRARIARLRERMLEGERKLTPLMPTPGRAADQRWPGLFQKWSELEAEYRALVLEHGEDR